MIWLHGKIYYLAPAYIMLLAGGVVWWERRIFSRAAAWLKPAIVAPLIASAVIAAPFGDADSARRGCGEILRVLGRAGRQS